MPTYLECNLYMSCLRFYLFKLQVSCICHERVINVIDGVYCYVFIYDLFDRKRFIKTWFNITWLLNRLYESRHIYSFINKKKLDLSFSICSINGLMGLELFYHKVLLNSVQTQLRHKLLSSINAIIAVVWWRYGEGKHLSEFAAEDCLGLLQLWGL